MNSFLTCSNCGASVEKYRNPAPTTDVIIFDAAKNGVVLIERANPPHGYALPGGFVDEGESVPHAAIREMLEETGLHVELEGILGVYSDPLRDPRFHTLSIVYVAKALNMDELCAGDDAAKAEIFPLTALPKLAFDHEKILHDFMDFLAHKRHLAPCNM